MSIRVLTQESIDNLIRDATVSTRKRSILRLHEHEELVQRMVNAVVPGTYAPPHKHENPDKVELFSILKGRVAILEFEVDGAVKNVYILDAAGPIRIIDIARAYTIHSSHLNRLLHSKLFKGLMTPGRTNSSRPGHRQKTLAMPRPISDGWNNRLNPLFEREEDNER